MASILDTIKEALSSPEKLVDAVASKIASAAESADVVGTLAQKITSPVASFTSAATESADALRTVAQKITSGEFEAKIDRALTTAETWVAITSGAQLLAAVAAVGIFVVQKKAYDHITARRRPTAVRHTKRTRGTSAKHRKRGKNARRTHRRRAR